MVVRIRTGKSIRGVISYNERKVSKGEARLIGSSGFIAKVEDLGFTQKLKKFEYLQKLNDWVKTNTLHISLNFPPEEVLSDEKMAAIAKDYMERIGFGQQPYLVYRHNDTNHPHLHIVTTNIQSTRKAIRLHQLGKKLSEPARVAIEQKYGLVRAEDRRQRPLTALPTIGLAAAKYGKEETKHAITNIVTQVLQSFRFSDFAEFNSILRQFNVVADRGRPDSQTFQTGGLVYSLIDKNGYRVGRAIKASEIYGSPILKNIEKKYAINTPKKAFILPVAKESVSTCLYCSGNILQFYEQLKQRRLSMEIEKDGFGEIQRVYFIDHKMKACFSHEELGVSLNQISRLRALSRSIISPQATTQSRSSRKTARTAHTPSSSGKITKQAVHILFRTEHGSPGRGSEMPLPRKKKRRP
jgi:hypothetical protein